MSINIQGINDPPIFSTPTLITLNEDSEILINDFSVSDVDIADYPLELDLAVTNGVINISDTLDIDFDYGGYGENEPSFFSGTITAVNNLLNSIIFLPNEHFNGTVQLEAFVDDLGADGTGGSLTDNQYLTIDVIPVNDAPEAIDDSYTITEEQELTGNVYWTMI